MPYHQFPGTCATMQDPGSGTRTGLRLRLLLAPEILRTSNSMPFLTLSVQVAWIEVDPSSIPFSHLTVDKAISHLSCLFLQPALPDSVSGIPPIILDSSCTQVQDLPGARGTWLSELAAKKTKPQDGGLQKGTATELSVSHGIRRNSCELQASL